MITTFLQIQAQLKVLHWYTTSYAQHKALGVVYDALDDLFDRYVETCFGVKGRRELQETELTITPLRAEVDVITFADSLYSELLNLDTFGLAELENQKQEILSCALKLKYLLTLH